MKSFKQITVIGPIASGKTTAGALLAEHFNFPLIDADLFDENPFLPHYVKDTPRWSFATELFFTIQRIKKLKTLPQLLLKSHVVVDSGLIMSHQVYAKNHLVQGTMTAAEWEFFTSIVADYQHTVPMPDIVVYLKASPELQMKRILKRGRSFEADYQLEYLEQITDRLEEYAGALASLESVTFLPFSTETFDIATKKGADKLIEVVAEVL
jgi:deoxyguanosine kinase